MIKKTGYRHDGWEDLYIKVAKLELLLKEKLDGFKRFKVPQELIDITASSIRRLGKYKARVAKRAFISHNGK